MLASEEIEPMRNIGCAAAVVLISIAVRGAAAAEDVSQDIEACRGDTPGVVAAIVRSNEIVAIGAAGIRRRGVNEQVKIDDVFHIGSDTKAMTATLCGILVDEKKLKWSTTLGEVFPELKAKMKPVWAGVTLEQLLTHHAGVEADSTKQAWWKKAWAKGLDPVKGRQMMLEDIVARDPEAQPGEKYIYSNAGVAIAGHMAEKVSHTPWEKLITDKLFKPLGMTSAGFGAPVGAHAVWGHGALDAAVPPGPGADNPETIGPAATVHCTISDWAKFVQMHLKGGRGERTLVSPETMAKLQTPIKAKGPDEPDYAMGWIVVDRPWAGGKTLVHAGSNTMWFCEVWAGPTSDIAVLVMANSATPAAQLTVRQVEGRLLRKYAK
jgi:CubicO group peptidase (beta-lactamase class C family)